MKKDELVDLTWLLIGIFAWSAFMFLLGGASGLALGGVDRALAMSVVNYSEKSEEAVALRERLAQEMILKAERMLQDAFLAQKVNNVMVSWYGEPYHGQVAASGIVYDMNLRHLAHRSLPFGTVVGFFNPDNQTSSWGVIVDRGPFVDGRIYDLSRLIARELGIERTGVAMVRSWVISLGLGRLQQQSAFHSSYTELYYRVWES